MGKVAAAKRVMVRKAPGSLYKLCCNFECMPTPLVCHVLITASQVAWLDATCSPGSGQYDA